MIGGKWLFIGDDESQVSFQRTGRSAERALSEWKSNLRLLWRQSRFLQRRAEQLRVDLVAAQREAERFREEAHDALRGLREAIDRQFSRWILSPAEREIGLLLLKGLSHKEIAKCDLRVKPRFANRRWRFIENRGCGIAPSCPLSFSKICSYLPSSVNGSRSPDISTT